MRHRIDPKVDYGKLRPTYAIWLLCDVLLTDDPNYAHDIRLRDAAGRVFGEHGGIRLLEIAKFAIEAVETEQERWVKFFKVISVVVQPRFVGTDLLDLALLALGANLRPHHALRVTLAAARHDPGRRSGIAPRHGITPFQG